MSRMLGIIKYISVPNICHFFYTCSKKFFRPGVNEFATDLPCDKTNYSSKLNAKYCKSLPHTFQIVLKLDEPRKKLCMRGNLCKSIAWSCYVQWRPNHSVFYPFNKLIYIGSIASNLKKVACCAAGSILEHYKTSRELRMLSNVTLYCQVTMIVIFWGSQLLEMSTISQLWDCHLRVFVKCLQNSQILKNPSLEVFSKCICHLYCLWYCLSRCLEKNHTEMQKRGKSEVVTLWVQQQR